MRKLSIIILLLLPIFWMACEKSNDIGNVGGGTGQGGSTARFTVTDDNYLYIVDGQNLKSYDISTPGIPVFKNEALIGRNIEALFPFEGNLFIASNNAMYIYNLNNPAIPEFESRVQHLTGCDPVVTDGTFAYLTIHGGNRCGSEINELNVYNVTNLANPQLISSTSMTSPYGLGLKGKTLYVCDRGEGIKVMDVSDPNNVLTVTTLAEPATDVIVVNNTNLLICKRDDGISYFDISTPLAPSKLAEIVQ